MSVRNDPRTPRSTRLEKLRFIAATSFLAGLLNVPLWPVLAFGIAALCGATIVSVVVGLHLLVWGVVSLPGALCGLLRRAVALRANKA